MTFAQRLKSFFRPKASSVDVMSASGRGYKGASFNSWLRQWFPSFGTPDGEIINDLQTLRTRSRDLYKNSDIGRGAIRVLVTNVIGAGLSFQANVDRTALGLTEEQATLWEDETERRFNVWAGSNEADSQRRKNFYQLQSLAYLSKLQSGDCFALTPLRERSGSDFRLRVKLIEADSVESPVATTNGQPSYWDLSNIRGGVEFDANNEPIRYWMRPNPYKYEWTSIAAFGLKSGRQNVIHLFDEERPGQSRGVPLLAPIMQTIKQIDRYEESELAAAVVSSFYTIFIKQKENNPNILDNPLQSLKNQHGNIETAEEKAFEYNLAPGAIIALGEGEEIQLANPSRPNSLYEQFIHALMKSIGMALEIPYEILVKQFNASYSASRASKLEFWKTVVAHRSQMEYEFCRPVYELWLADEILRGKIKAPGFFENPMIRAAWCGHSWIGDPMGQLDPLKEVQAARERIDLALTTHQREAMEINGSDFKTNVSKLKFENVLKQGLPSLTMPQVVQPQNPAQGGE